MSQSLKISLAKYLWVVVTLTIFAVGTFCFLVVFVRLHEVLAASLGQKFGYQSSYYNALLEYSGLGASFIFVLLALLMTWFLKKKQWIPSLLVVIVFTPLLAILVFQLASVAVLPD